ncbi:MAG: YajG family lipoprotein [Shewanella sp.]|nr:YajG family lipoprotein [Shewanella sp.]MCF1430472.1 YajG family lipoprotein [Shewanella sp.]MCF1438279.1 YajG family lipoprotein [Shewanella sp.]MCF1457767.1 YajG family lipoprotein [Shewanella sp.]
MKSLVSALAVLLLLGGCASQSPNYIVLDPQLEKIPQQTTQALPLSVSTRDLRTANYVVKFDEGNGAAKLVSPSDSPRAQLEALLRKGFANAGYSIDPASARSLHVDLDQLLTLVTESTFGYEANTRINIKVLATNGNQTLAKEFVTKGRKTGPMGADFATLELKLNKLMTQIAMAVIQDKEINNFLTQGGQQ